MANTFVSKWINFLRKYGPIPRNDNMYDEAIQRALKRNKIEPIKFETPYLQELINNFKSDFPKSVILTGTAGDGKTFCCREIWETLGGTQEEWGKEQKIQSLSISDKQLIIIKDLSEIQDGEKKQLLPEIAQSIVEPQTTHKIYLIAANDGQLIEAWNIANQDHNIQEARQLIETLLVEEKKQIQGFNLLLYNLSRLNNEDMFYQILDAVLNHSGWQECNECIYKDAANLHQRCPIWENKKRLDGNDDQQLMRKRLIDLLELLRHNGMHIPIRQLLLLISNLLLGHPDAKDKLLTCQQIPDILATKTAYLASPYSNIFGGNLSIRKRNKTDVFTALRYFCIGTESSNYFDNLLIFGADDPAMNNDYQELISKDPYYGEYEQFRIAQTRYLEENDLPETKEAFLSLLETQRQRLFFTIPEDRSSELNLWELTVFYYAGDYLEKICRPLKRRQKIPKSLISQLVKGMNRIFTGLFMNNPNELILATSGSYSQARISKVFEESISVHKKRGESVSIELNSEHNAPDFVIFLSSHPEIAPVQLRLNLTRYEYLNRVAEGALPSNFSQECYEDMLAFKTKILGQINLRKQKEEQMDDSSENEIILRLLELRSVESVLMN
ncbi:hypothetical protein K4A83_21955 [Spirulina subsalsa FACHB-351]|uniref:Uncharacterized protein n=1 Tax=Spirulina subsalsa FACHB-351 TaxID=234711 RepID=A0ABT3LBL3_9CYAN|nr:hypothetical protein [Spirulina subsalsa]MCW6038900.1 hypothetical protein [Spirulina subsalsa FACHB-351]